MRPGPERCAFFSLAPCEIECNLLDMVWGRYLKVWRDRFLRIGPLLILGSAQAEVVPWPLTGSAVAGEGAVRLECVNNLLEISFAARRFANDAGQFPSSFQALTNYLASPQPLHCPANAAHSPPASWAELDWNDVEYEWVLQTDPHDSATQLCRCKIHNNSVNADGYVTTLDGYSPGWPAFIAHPLGQEATPGSQVRYEARIVANALQPLVFQWRREHLSFVTNVTFIPDTNAPDGGFFKTNRLGNFTVTVLSGETNAVYTIPNAQTNQADYYSLAVSNSMGVTISQRAQLQVDSTAPVRATNDYWSAVRCLNNLKQIRLLASIRETLYAEQAITNFSQMLHYDGSPMFEWPVLLYCPADKARTPPGDWNNFDFSNTSYEMLSHPSIDEDPAAPFCQCRVHHYFAAMDSSVGYAANSPLFVGQLVDQTAAFGSDVVFRVDAIGLGPLTFTWHKNGQPLLTTTNGILILTRVVRADSGTYSVVVNNSVDRVQSSTATLTVQVPQRLTHPQVSPQGVLQLIAGYADGWPVFPEELPGFEAQVSSNLADWTTLANSLTVSNSGLILQDRTSSSQAGRFYRILQHPL
jgi:hypothetical protein